MKFNTYVVILLFCLLTITKTWSKTIFDVSAAAEGKQEMVEKLKESHRMYFIKSFEHHLRHHQKLLQMQLKFIDDLTAELEGIEIANKRDFNDITRHHQKLVKEFEKASKRRLKFYEKDLVKPLEKQYRSELKEIVKSYKEKSRDWKIKQ